MTFPSMESSETPQETESNEVQETVESPEVLEAAEQLEQATYEPEAVVELEGSHEEAELVEAAFTEVMKATEAPADKVAPQEAEARALPEERSLQGAHHKDDPLDKASAHTDEDDSDAYGKQSAMESDEDPQPESHQSTLRGQEQKEEEPSTYAKQSVMEGEEGTSPYSHQSNQEAEEDSDPYSHQSAHVQHDEDVSPPQDTDTSPEVDLTARQELKLDQSGDDVAIGTWPTPDKATDGISIIDSNDSPSTRDDPEMIANAPASYNPSNAEVDLSNVVDLQTSGAVMQIIANILKIERGVNNHIIENRRGADAETGDEEPQEEGVNLTPDDVKTAIGTWPESDASPEMQMESIEDHLPSGGGDNLSPDGAYEFVGNENTSAQDISDHVTGKSDSASLPEKKSEGLGGMREVRGGMGDAGGMPGGADNSGNSGGPTIGGMDDMDGGYSDLGGMGEIPGGGAQSKVISGTSSSDGMAPGGLGLDAPGDMGTNGEIGEESMEKQETGQALQQATFEPEMAVELEGNHEEAEALEIAFTEVMKAAEGPNMDQDTPPPEKENEEQKEDDPNPQSMVQVHQQREQMLNHIRKAIKDVESSVIRKLG